MHTAVIVLLALLCLILAVDLFSLERGMRRKNRSAPRWRVGPPSG